MIELVTLPSSHGWHFQLNERTLIGRSRRVTISEWSANAPAKLLHATSRLIAWIEDGTATLAEDGVLVPHAVIARLDAEAASSLRLPPPPPLVLDLNHEGTLDQASFRFSTSWLQLNGQPAHRLNRKGASLSVGSTLYRLPEPLFSILEAVDEFNAAPPTNLDDRLRAWARMQQVLPEDTVRSVQVGSYLRSTRIAIGAGFSVSLRSSAEGFDFDPVLFGPKAVSSDVDLDPSIANQEVQLLSEAEALLPPDQQEVFAKKRFRQDTECRAQYALGHGWYVVLDEPLRRALSVVRIAQQQDAQTRRAFARNPRAFLAAALEGQLPQDVLENLFIETAEYSERVQDVGVWQPKVLPWIKRSTDPWIPEEFAIQIGTRLLKVDPNELPSLYERLSLAIENGAETIEWGGTQVPATGEALRALQSLMAEVRPSINGLSEASSSPSPSGSDEESALPGKVVLEITDNLNDIGYQRPKGSARNSLQDRLPTCLRTRLKPHQEDGLAWLRQAWQCGEPGVLLADDMGLGKTLLTLTFLAILRKEMEERRLKRQPLLVVAPTGLLMNWQQEHDQHLNSPGLGEALKAYGQGLAALKLEAGKEIERGMRTLDTSRIAAADWVLTTYETLRDYQHSFATVPFGVIVFDEIQKIKTPGTVMTHAAKAMNADFIIGLTGTPIENRLADLWCIIDTIHPGKLGDLASFIRRYESDGSEENLRQLKSILTARLNDSPPILLRRMKADKLKGLPEKIEHPLDSIMPAEQAEAYSDAVNAARAGRTKAGILEALHRMRSISLHPFHPSAATDDERYIQQSARLALAIQVLDQIADAGEKALIFLESQEMQPYLAGLLQRRYRLPLQPMIINGAISGPKRQERVNRFQESAKGFDVMILSPRAGGVGLTLTAANHVIHLSRWWNPAVEDQCTDRVYRIGQRKAVHVYYLQALHPAFPEISFDRKLHELLARKRALSREMLMPPVGPNDAKELFDETVGSKSGGFSPVDLQTIDSMEPTEFEHWVLSRLRAAGHRVDRTPRTHDRGADGIAYHRISGRSIIIQCKHTQLSGMAPDQAISDLLRARGAYPVKDPQLVAITNASQFSTAAIRRAREEGILLVTRSELNRWPWLIDG